MFFCPKRISALAAVLLLTGCTAAPPVDVNRTTVRALPDFGFRRSVGDLDFSALPFTAWDGAGMAAALPPRPTAPYTVLIYMNGSDLEREHGAATDDLAEMLAALPDDPGIHVVVFTGGTNRWHNDVVPAPECALWQLTGGALVPLFSPGLRNMGDAGTLAGFLDFGMAAFPAERYGLILWDHGGGSIAGYGHDENFQDSCLTLLEMNYALSRAPTAAQKLEFLGFDACLMATVEMAVVGCNFARYLIASEDLEPGDGWDYSFLADLAADPHMDGAAVGRIIADRYADYYRGARTQVTLSVTDLSRVEQVMGAMGALMAVCATELDSGETVAPLTVTRRDTRAFGGGAPRDSACDMVDAGDMADRLAALHPREAADLRAALTAAVVYQRHNSDLPLAGLTCYYVFAGAAEADATLAVYRALGMSADYTDYLGRFAAALRDGVAAPQAVSRADDGTIGPGAGRERPTINGRAVALYQSGATQTGREYAAPILHNGRPADLIVWVDADRPDGHILGVRMEEGYVIQKGVDALVPGDTVIFLRPAQEGWAAAAPLIVDDAFTLAWQ